MDPQAFMRLSIGCLGIRVPTANPESSKPDLSLFSSPCTCKIRLRGFPVQTAQVPFISSPEATPNSHSLASSFYLEECDLKALLAPRCFYARHPCLEIAVFTGRKGIIHCGVGVRRQRIGAVRMNVGPEWSEGKPAVLLHGWIRIGRSGGQKRLGAELHLKVKLDPDPRYVFRFDDETKLSPQIVQLQPNLKQPIFSCKFNRDRVSSQVDPLATGISDQDTDRRERKGWKVKIHDLSGSVVAAAFITTPFVPSTGCDWVARSNPGAWLIVMPDACRPESWLPWGKLEAWRERGGGRDSVSFRFHIFAEDGELLLSENRLSAEKGGEFFIDTDRAAGPGPIPFAGGFVMSCRVEGEGRRSRPLVHLAMRHVTCVEDAAMFMALAAAVDLSVEACRTFRKRVRIGSQLRGRV